MQPSSSIMSSTSPNRYQSNGNDNSGGIEICCCRVCTCVNLGFLTSQNGMLKLFEVLLGSFCQTLLIKFGLSAASDMGQAFNSFLTTCSACLTTTMILLGCYIVSSKTFNLVRQSLFEVVYNTVACLLYCSASSYMGFVVNVWLYAKFVLTPAYIAYPAMTGVYVSIVFLE